MSDKYPVVLISEHIPEKNINKIVKYKKYLSPQERLDILSEIPFEIPDNCTVSMHTEIEIKFYNPVQTEDKNKQYNGIG